MRALAVMVAARLPIVQALDTTARQTDDEALAESLQHVAAQVRAGEGVADAFAGQARTVGPLAAGMVRVGMSSGRLDDGLMRLAEALERTATLQKKVRYALTYPAIVLAVAVGAVAFLLTFVVPTFADLFSDFGTDLPLPTRLLIGVSDGLRDYALLWVGLAGLGLVTARVALRSPTVQRRGEGVLLRLPFLGGLYRSVLTARFCRTLSTLLAGGVPLTEALATTADSTASPRMAAAVRDMRARVTSGEDLAAGVQRPDALFPPLLVQMVAVGEQTARLDETLTHTAENYEREVEGTVDALATIIEPVLIVLLGLVVGAILISIYLPMFDLVTAVE